MRRRWLWIGLTLMGWMAARRIRPFRVVVEGDSMEPALSHGDMLVATRPGRLRRGDVVVASPPGRSLEIVKRVAGVPGDPVAGGLRLGPDEYLLLGDNPPRSTDGRAFGPVRRRDVAGVVRFRYFPRPGPPARLRPKAEAGAETARG